MHTLHMGGFGQFIWPAYFAMLLIFAASLYVPLRRFRLLKAKARSLN